MSRLVPEKRADKNGRVVTRHVRPGGSTKASVAAIPSPMLSTEVSKRLDAAREMIPDYWAMTDDVREQVNKVIATLSDNDLTLASNLVLLTAKSQQGRTSRKIMFRQILQSHGKHSEKLRTADLMVRNSSLNPVLIVPFLNTLTSTKPFDDSVFDLTNCDAKMQRDVCLIADALTVLGKRREVVILDNGSADFADSFQSDGQSLTFRKPELFEAMAKHPERAMEILDWYRKRKSSTAGLDELLNSVPALGDGAL
jgi:hypothetical protein